jgi:hypothetical protein
MGLPSRLHQATSWVPEKALVLRVLVTLAALLAGGLSLFTNPPRVPFDSDLKSDFAVILPVSGMRLPDGIKSGDQINYAAQTEATLAVLLAPYVPAGVEHSLVLTRNGKSRVVQFHVGSATSVGLFLSLINAFSVLAILLLGLVTLWRGTDWSAWGLSVFALSILIGSAIGQTSLPPYWNIAAYFTQIMLTGPMPFYGLYLTSNALIGRPVTPRHARNWLYALILMVMIVTELAPMAMILVARYRDLILPLNVIGGCLAVCMLAVPILVLAAGFVTADATRKMRIKWVLAGTSLLIPLLLFSFLHLSALDQATGTILLVATARSTLTALIFAIYSFAVLSTRLVEVRVVINRAVVFTTLMTLVVGFLGVTESLIERSAIGGSASLALEVAVPLGLGALFHQAQQKIEALVDRVFFRREHQSRATLREFVRDAGYVESAELLVERMVTAFARHACGAGAAVYEQRGRRFERLASLEVWPDSIDADDAALVRLRATLTPLDLHALGSELGADGVALPLALRGRLFGVLVCGPRAAGRYAQTEILELGQAARDVGASLFALRARLNEGLIERLAQGKIELDEAVVEARQLIRI